MLEFINQELIPTNEEIKEVKNIHPLLISEDEESRLLGYDLFFNSKYYTRVYKKENAICIDVNDFMYKGYRYFLQKGIDLLTLLQFVNIIIRQKDYRAADTLYEIWYSNRKISIQQKKK